MQSIVGIRRELREQLAQRYTLEQGRILTHNTSEDGTRKFLMQFGAGQEIESALPVPRLKRRSSPSMLLLTNMPLHGRVQACSSPSLPAARCASPRRSAAPCRAASATRERSLWY